MDALMAQPEPKPAIVDPVALECDRLQMMQGRLMQQPILHDRDRAAMQNELSKIEHAYNQLWNAHPKHPKVLMGMAIQALNTDRASMAIMLMREAVQLPGGNIAAVWQNLAGAYKLEHRDDEAEAAYQQCLALIEGGDMSARVADAVAGIGSLFVNRGCPEKVIEWTRLALTLAPNDRFALWNNGLGHLENGDWAEGFRLYDEAGFMDGGLRPKERKERLYWRHLKKWNGEKGVTVVCYGEQGIGDEIMFFSMLPDLMRDCKVVVECDGRMIDLMRASFPQAEGIYATSGAKDHYNWLADHPDVTHWVAVGSLGRHYRKKADDFPRTPYLRPEAYLSRRWGAALEPYRNLRVGLSWRGGLKKTRADKRSMALKSWAPILQTPGVDFFSLQYHRDAADECAAVGRELGVPIHHWQDMIDSYERTAGFLSNIDMVVTVNTSVVHLAGALGVPTLCLTPVYCAWRYGVRGRNPFYGSVEMLRQKDDGDWKPVIERARQRVAGAAIRKGREAA